MRREEIVAEARSWIGTPYRHQASLKGVGCDCLGLVRGVWRAKVGPEPELVPPYSPDWAEALGEETLLEAGARHMAEVPASGAKAGDVLIFRMGTGVPAKHCGMATGEGSVVHAYWGRAAVETRLVPWWRRRIVAAFRLPGVED
ncbi:MAG: NlpC/P60 family protein [Hyphomonas sp.]|uniref:NlpC/P60 family protein n=1 Tax=Hyphomonas sp. TaxID=87 RepID=UPI00352781C1